MVVFFCEFYWDYGAQPNDKGVLIRKEKTGVCGGIDYYYDRGHDYDFADNSILLWCSFLDFFGGKYVDITDSVVGDGAGVFDRRGGGNTGYRERGSIFGEAVTDFSYLDSGIIRRYARACGSYTTVSVVGVFDTCGCGGNDSDEVSTVASEKEDA